MWRGVMPRADEIAKLKAARAAVRPLRRSWFSMPTYLINLPACSRPAGAQELDQSVSWGG